MDISLEVNSIIGQQESEVLEYKAVLPPSRLIAQIISSFANGQGGLLILGVSKKSDSTFEINGLSEDFHANSIVHKAIDLLSPAPLVTYQYVSYKNKRVYAIKTQKSDAVIKLEGKIYKREGIGNIIQNQPLVQFKQSGFSELEKLSILLSRYKSASTNAKLRLLEHYQSVLKIFDDLGQLLYPVGQTNFTPNPEGKVLNRIIFTSFVDNFETYLSDLLYEIFLANPSTLKSSQSVTIEEVLNCSDLQEFIHYWAKQKISKLQKGSVKGFIKENKQIKALDVLKEEDQDKIEKILQIRHLYSHRNGIVDEKFLQFFPGVFQINSEHQMTVEEICSKLSLLASVVNTIDFAAINKYKLAVAN